MLETFQKNFCRILKLVNNILIRHMFKSKIMAELKKLRFPPIVNNFVIILSLEKSTTFCRGKFHHDTSIQF